MSRPLRVALVLEDFSPAKGGGESYVFNLSRELVARGNEVHVFASRWESPAAGIVVHRVGAPLPGRTLRMAWFALRVRKALAGLDADVAHAVGKALGMNLFNPHGGIEACWLEQNFRSIRSPVYRFWKKASRYVGLRHHFISWLERAQYSDPGVLRVIAISDMVKRDIVNAYPAAADRVRVVYNGVDLERFHPRNRGTHRAAVRAETGTPPEAPVLLQVSNNFRLKGLATLVEALASVRESSPGKGAELWVLGRGRPGPYARLARSLGVADAVKFLGRRPAPERYYAAADVYAHPTYYDACSLAVLEAMATGLPAVTTSTNGASGYIREGVDGFVLDDAADAPGLAKLVLRCLEPVFREKACGAARARAEEFPLSRNTDEVVKVYDEVAEERRRRGV